MKPYAFWLSLVLAFALSGAVFAAPEARTYALSNRPAQDVAQQLRELYPDNQLAISAQGQQMIIRGEPVLLDEVSRLVETMDVAPVQLRITVRSGHTTDRDRQGDRITFSNGNVGVQAERKVITTRRSQEQNLVVQDGQSAHISSGQIRTLPVAIRGGRNPAAILQQVDIRSGFIISPHVISDRQVELSVMAFDNTPQNDIPGYETEAVMTIRRVEPGEWVALGGSSTRQSGNSAGITYEAGGRHQDTQSFEVRVDVL